jgi:hypothetical protein
MRRLCLLVVFLVLSLGNTGCFINMWSSDPNDRLKEELIVSENLRQAKNEWRRFWLLDEPSHMTPSSLHGGVMPADWP